MSSHYYLKGTVRQLNAVYFIQQTVYIYNSKDKSVRESISTVFWFAEGQLAFL